MTKKSRGPVQLIFVALFLTLVGCSSESPTAPPSGGGGGTPNPTTNADITLAVSNATPLVGSTSTITATVRLNGQPVANGTAVEFTTTFGTFTDTAATTTIRTTTGGVSSATLTSSTAGSAVVTVRVNNVNRQVTITFRTDGGTGGTVPVINSFTPVTSRPSGGQVVVIRGANFAGPLRVLFGTKEATVVSSSATEIQVVVPSIDLGASAQFKDVTITVINRAGTSDERSITSSTPFRYQIEILTPVIYTISPASGPNEGNTRITIFGEGFQAPTRVFFGTGGGTGALTDQVELEVMQVNFGQIIAVTPPALGLGAPLRDQQVAVRVLNVATNKEAFLDRGFRYGPGMVITAAGPTRGTALGGTSVTIYGWGFDDPVAVTIGGVAAQPIRVSGTEIVAITSPLAQPCGGSTGPITVVNIEDGASAEGPDFEYIGVDPIIVSVLPSSITAGGNVTISIANAGAGIVRFRVADQIVLGGSGIVNPDGTTSYTIAVPTNISLTTQPCPTGTGVRSIPTPVDIAFNNVSTGCSDDLAGALIVLPPATGQLRVTPTALAIPGAVAPNAGGTGGSPRSGFFTIQNTGAGPLTIQSITEVGDGCDAFTGDPFVPPQTLPSCGTLTYNVTFAPGTGELSCSTSYQVVSDGGSATVAVTGTATQAP